jgi:hypothetical protein
VRPTRTLPVRQQKYNGPVTVATGDRLTWLAVDVNGNYEATQSITV